MIEEILPDFYRVQITLPNSPLKSLNSYIIRGTERCLIIDTGMNRQECLNDMSVAVHELGVDLERCDFFITHMHTDHLGLLGNLVTATSKTYFNEVEAAIVDPDYRERRKLYIDAFMIANGFPCEEYRLSIGQNPGRQYNLKTNIDFTFLKEHDRLVLQPHFPL